MGAIPITSRHMDSALNETAGLWDLGPAPRDGLIGKNEAWLAEWVEHVVAAATHPALHEHRRKMKQWARAKFSWERAGQQWHHIFQHGVGAQGSVDIDVLAPLAPALDYPFVLPNWLTQTLTPSAASAELDSAGGHLQHLEL